MAEWRKVPYRDISSFLECFEVFEDLIELPASQTVATLKEMGQEELLDYLDSCANNDDFWNEVAEAFARKNREGLRNFLNRYRI